MRCWKLNAPPECLSQDPNVPRVGLQMMMMKMKSEGLDALDRH